MEKNLGKKYAIVMGATSGIGREVALELARRGWTVGVAGRRAERLSALVRGTEGIVAARAIDVTGEEAPALLEELAAATGGMDLYFHSSGIGWQNLNIEVGKELQTVATNAAGFVRMVDTAFHWMRRHGGGHIACISSIAGTKGLGAAPAYSSTKRFQSHYIESLTQLARLQGLSVRFTDFRPGFVATDLIANGHYPLQLSAARVARQMVDALERNRRVVVIDWRYRLLVVGWRLIPRWLWVRLRIR